ncbi:MAG: preprotein translocase subunit YajC [Isosphaeraceae bacterium]|nr:preprotein translocase subunit YajC [Isosphaeraceae bacterium]
MPGLIAEIPLLFAQNQAPARGGDGGLFATLLMFLPVILLFYFIMIRPQQIQERKRREMIDALKKNDRVLTQAGIYGTVVSVNPDTGRIVLRVDDERGVKLEFNKASVIQVVDAAEKKDKERAAETV